MLPRARSTSIERDENSRRGQQDWNGFCVHYRRTGKSVSIEFLELYRTVKEGKSDIKRSLKGRIIIKEVNSLN